MWTFVILRVHLRDLRVNRFTCQAGLLRCDSEIRARAAGDPLVAQGEALGNVQEAATESRQGRNDLPWEQNYCFAQPRNSPVRRIPRTLQLHLERFAISPHIGW